MQHTIEVSVSVLAEALAKAFPGTIIPYEGDELLDILIYTDEATREVVQLERQEAAAKVVRVVAPPALTPLTKAEKRLVENKRQVVKPVKVKPKSTAKAMRKSNQRNKRKRK